MGKDCEFAKAYVIAHEVGHHVQNLLGILRPAQRRLQITEDRVMANFYKVKMELQADCFAGRWAKHANNRLQREGKPPLVEASDIEAATQTAAALGNDRLRMAESGQVALDSFTDGTSEQRVRWFLNGMRDGVADCNPFKVLFPSNL